MKKSLIALMLLLGSSAFAENCYQYEVLKTLDTTGNNMVVMTDINSVYTNSEDNLVIRFDSITVSPSFTSKCKFVEFDSEKVQDDENPFRWDKSAVKKLSEFKNLAQLASALGANLGFTLATDNSGKKHYIGAITMAHGFSISPRGKSAERLPMNRN